MMRLPEERTFIKYDVYISLSRPPLLSLPKPIDPAVSWLNVLPTDCKKFAYYDKCASASANPAFSRAGVVGLVSERPFVHYNDCVCVCL